jgi:hypothetical protein
MAGRYDDKNAFIERLDPIIRRQLEIYREDPEIYREDPAEYIRALPMHMNLYFVENSPSRKISLACLLAESLIATHRFPTAEYIWQLMSKQSSSETWNPRDDPGLTDARS